MSHHRFDGVRFASFHGVKMRARFSLKLGEDTGNLASATAATPIRIELWDSRKWADLWYDEEEAIISQHRARSSKSLAVVAEWPICKR